MRLAIFFLLQASCVLALGCSQPETKSSLDELSLYAGEMRAWFVEVDDLFTVEYRGRENVFLERLDAVEAAPPMRQPHRLLRVTFQTMLLADQRETLEASLSDRPGGFETISYAGLVEVHDGEVSDLTRHQDDYARAAYREAEQAWKNAMQSTCSLPGEIRFASAVEVAEECASQLVD